MKAWTRALIRVNLVHINSWGRLTSFGLCKIIQDHLLKRFSIYGIMDRIHPEFSCLLHQDILWQDPSCRLPPQRPIVLLIPTPPSHAAF